MSFKPGLLPAIIAAVFSMAITVNAVEWSYRVRAGDTLSEIVATHLGKPIFSKGGFLEQILKFNPEVTNRDRIYVGQNLKLRVPGERVPASENQNDDASPAVSVSDEISVPSFRRHSSFSLQPSYRVSHIFSTDSATGVSSTIASDLNISVEGRYHQHWSPGFQSFIGMNLNYIAFAKPTSASKSIADEKQWRSGVFLGFENELSSNLSIETIVSYDKEIFIRALGTNVITFDSIYTPSLRAKLKYDLVELSPFTFGITGFGGYKASSSTDSYSIQNGSEFGGSAFLKESAMTAEAGVGVRNQNTSIATQKETTVFVNVHFSFDSPEKSK